MKKTILLSLSLIMIGQSAFSLTVNCTAGGLATAVGAEYTTVTNLTVTGVIDAQDFKTMKSGMPALSSIDLSGVSVVAYTGTGGPAGSSSYVYAANTIPNAAFSNKNGLTSITIPSSVTSIVDGAFTNCIGLTFVSIPSSVTSIKSSAFESCSGLTSITIPSSVTSIEGNAFKNCTGLTSISIPSSITSIKVATFSGCTGLTSIVIPASITSIESNAFYYCSKSTSISIPSSVTSIGSSALMGCSGLITVDAANPTYSSIEGILYNKAKNTLIQCPTGKTGSFVIPSSVISIGSNAFNGCSTLMSLTIPSSVTTIGSSAFNICSGLTSISIPSSVTSIEGAAFSGCTGLTSISIPSSITSILGFVFRGCTGLTSITIPSSVNSIGSGAFFGCTSLITICAKKTTPVDLSSSSMAFGNVNATTCTLYVPIGSGNAYRAAVQWLDFTNIVEGTPSSITNLPNSLVKVYPTQSSIIIEGTSEGETVSVYNLIGTKLQTIQSQSERLVIPMEHNGVYLVKTANKTVKVLL